MMKTARILFSGIFALACILYPALLPAASAAGGGTDYGNVPVAVIPSPQFDFGEVVEGKVVIHAYAVQNQGRGTLRIENVRTGCGCTTAEYTKAIPPGGEGRIVIRGDTRDEGGSLFHRTIVVTTNDPARTRVELVLDGKVDRFALVKPFFVRLEGKRGSPITAEVSIRRLPKYPFSIVKSYASLIQDKIRFTLDKAPDGYRLNVANRATTPGRYFGSIHLVTDNPDYREIVIHVYGVIQ
jgi:Protein of unknown function (DUF1573)